MCSLCSAQQRELVNPTVPSSVFTTANKNRTSTSLALLSEFEGPPEDEYTLAEGDELWLEVWEHPELSGKHIVGPDGRITLSQAGPIQLRGLSRAASAKSIADAYGKLYLSPLVTVRVDRYASNHVLVLGRVMKPGVLDFDTMPTLLEAITRAGGLPVGGAGAEKAALARCAVFRGRDKVVWIELRKLLQGENLALNIKLHRNDVVYIPDSDDQLVYVLGEVHTPGAYRLTPTMTFLDALSLAGGPTRDANDKKIRIVRPSEHIDREISMNDLLSTKSEINVALNDGDIIYVQKRGLAKVGYVMEKIAPFTTFLFFGTTLSNSLSGTNK